MDHHGLHHPGKNADRSVFRLSAFQLHPLGPGMPDEA